jgi:hypothetical protein
MVAPGPGSGYPSASEGPVCPRCQNTHCSTPKYTWWGGFLGPKIIPHVKCGGCGYSFKPTTGQPITGAIIIYSVVVAVIVFAIVIGINSH